MLKGEREGERKGGREGGRNKEEKKTFGHSLLSLAAEIGYSLVAQAKSDRRRDVFVVVKVCTWLFGVG